MKQFYKIYLVNRSANSPLSNSGMRFLEKHRKRDQDFLAKGEGKAYRGLFIEGN